MLLRLQATFLFWLRISKKNWKYPFCSAKTWSMVSKKHRLLPDEYSYYKNSKVNSVGRSGVTTIKTEKGRELKPGMESRILPCLFIWCGKTMRLKKSMPEFFKCKSEANLYKVQVALALLWQTIQRERYLCLEITPVLPRLKISRGFIIV